MTEISDTLKSLKPGGLKEFSVMMELFYAYCELRMPPTLSVNKGYCSHQTLTRSLFPPGNSECKQRRPTIPHHSAAASSQVVPPGDSGWESTGKRGPASWGAHQRTDCRELRLLHFPKHRKVLNSLTWDICSSINSNHLMFWLPGFGGINIYISWLLSCLFRTISQELFKMLYPGLKSSDLFTE